MKKLLLLFIIFFSLKSCQAQKELSYSEIKSILDSLSVAQIDLPQYNGQKRKLNLTTLMRFGDEIYYSATPPTKKQINMAKIWFNISDLVNPFYYWNGTTYTNIKIGSIVVNQDIFTGNGTLLTPLNLKNLSINWNHLTQEVKDSIDKKGLLRFENGNYGVTESGVFKPFWNNDLLNKISLAPNVSSIVKGSSVLGFNGQSISLRQNNGAYIDVWQDKIFTRGGGLGIPFGNTAQRLSNYQSNTDGMVYFNTDSNCLQVLKNSIINPIWYKIQDTLQFLKIENNKLVIHGTTDSVAINSFVIPQTPYTAGVGINIANNVVTNTGDLSNTNEIQTLSTVANGFTLSGQPNVISFPLFGNTYKMFANSQAAMLALVKPNALSSIICFRTDFSPPLTFMLDANGNPTVLNDWQPINVTATTTNILTNNTVNKTITSNVNGITSTITVDKNFIGLTNVDNTSDLNKPLSIATTNALNLKLNISDTSQFQRDADTVAFRGYSDLKYLKKDDSTQYKLLTRSVGDILYLKPTDTTNFIRDADTVSFRNFSNLSYLKKLDTTTNFKILTRNIGEQFYLKLLDTIGNFKLLTRTIGDNLYANKDSNIFKHWAVGNDSWNGVLLNNIFTPFYKDSLGSGSNQKWKSYYTSNHVFNLDNVNQILFKNNTNNNISLNLGVTAQATSLISNLENLGMTVEDAGNGAAKRMTTGSTALFYGVNPFYLDLFGTEYNVTDTIIRNQAKALVISGRLG